MELPACRAFSMTKTLFFRFGLTKTVQAINHSEWIKSFRNRVKFFLNQESWFTVSKTRRLTNHWKWVTSRIALWIGWFPWRHFQSHFAWNSTTENFRRFHQLRKFTMSVLSRKSREINQKFFNESKSQFLR